MELESWGKGRSLPGSHFFLGNKKGNPYDGWLFWHFFIFSQTGSGGFHLDPGKPISLEMIRVSIACDPCYWRSQNLFDTVATCGDDS